MTLNWPSRRTRALIAKRVPPRSGHPLLLPSVLTVALPSGLAAWLAWRRSPWAPVAVLVASALLATELLFQIPFLGLSLLQLIFGTVAIGMAVVAFLARKAGWWPRGRPKESM